MAKLFPFTQHEAVLLLEAYIETQRPGALRPRVVKQLSNDLRQMALNKGLVIDEVYRNTNGISFQLSSMESAYVGTTLRKPATRLFSETVALYRENHEEYEKLLKEAKSMVSGHPTNEQRFMDWLATQLPSRKVPDLHSVFVEIELFCRKIKVLRQPLFETFDYETIAKVKKTVEQNKIFTITHKKQMTLVRMGMQYYSQYIRDGHYNGEGSQTMSTPAVTDPVQSKVIPEPLRKIEDANSNKPVAIQEKDKKIQSTDSQPEETALSKEERIRAALKYESKRNSYGTTIEFLRGMVHLPEKEIKAILSQAQWAEFRYGKYFYVETKIEANDSQSQPDTNPDELVVDFLENESYRFTKPVSYTYAGSTYKVASWQELYVDICGLLFSDYRGEFLSVMNKDVPGLHTLAFADGRNYKKMLRPRPFAPGYYIETNMDANSIMRRIKGLYLLMGLGDLLKITYRRADKNLSIASGKAASAPQLPTDTEYDWHREGLQIADWTKDDPYTYTQPEAYAYNGVTKRVDKWGTLYTDVCGLLFSDYHDIFMTVMNGDVPGYNTLAFADEEHKDSIRSAKIFAPGYYLEANAGATTIMRRIRGLVMLCGVEDKLLVSYHSSKERISLPSYKSTVETDEGAYVIGGFKRFLLEKQGLAEKTAVNYCTYLRAVEEYMKQHELGTSLLDATADSIHDIISTLMARRDFEDTNTQSHHKYSAALGQFAYYLGGTPPMFKSMPENQEVQEKAIDVPEPIPVDVRWQAILADSFPDGYILDDFLSQFQASAYWQERYDENCPIEGAAIDDAMKALGSVRDGRVYAKKEEDNQLISEICDEINSILSQFSTVYRSSIYERYRDQLAACSIYTEQVMTQQLKATAKGSFYSTYQVFAHPGQEPSVMQDCRKVLRNHGGAMSASDVSKELWFIPYDTVYQSLVNDSEALNIGNSVWMLAEHFPLTKEDAGKIGDMLDECFLTQDFIQQSELMPLLQQHLPSIADNLSGLHFIAVFNILNYHLKNRFGFSKAIISPKGAKTDFRDLFRGFAREHERFTLDELSAFASELSVPIYWESTFDGGAVRLNKAEFINRKQISFDVELTDEVLESFCTGDYLSIQALSSAMMVHLPPCGYSWNGFLLISYLYGFSKTFRLIYNSISKTGYYGAMVRRSCKEIDSYERLLERILTDDNTWSTEAEALSLLVKEGYQARLRLNGIGQIVEKARQNKLTDGM